MILTCTEVNNASSQPSRTNRRLGPAAEGRPATGGRPAPRSRGADTGVCPYGGVARQGRACVCALYPLQALFAPPAAE